MRQDDSTVRKAAMALRMAAEDAIAMIEGGRLYEQQCCSGHMCGCRGSTYADEIVHYLRKALESSPADADATEHLIAAVDAWIEDPDSNAEQEIMDARAALRGLGGGEG